MRRTVFGGRATRGAQANGPMSTPSMMSVVVDLPVVTRIGAMSGIDFDVAAWSRHTHQNISFGFLAGLQSLFGIHVYITLEQFGDTSPAAPLTATGRDLYAAHFRNLEQGLAGGHTAHSAGTRKLDRALQWRRGVRDGAATGRCISEALPFDAFRANSQRLEYVLHALHERRWPAEKNG